MKILWIGLGLVAVLGTGGVAYYFLYADREVETGTFRGFTWRIIKRSGLGDEPGAGTFCAEIRDTRTPLGFARFEGGTFQKLGCHATINTAKGEALEAILNIIEGDAFVEVEGTGSLLLESLPALPDVATYVGPPEPVEMTFVGGG